MFYMLNNMEVDQVTVGHQSGMFGYRSAGHSNNNENTNNSEVK